MKTKPEEDITADRSKDGLVVVTRHAALVRLLAERSIIDDTATVIEHATIDDIRNRDVVGNLPLNLAASANSVTVIPLDMSDDDRGKDLGIERLRKIAGEPESYLVVETTPVVNAKGE